MSHLLDVNLLVACAWQSHSWHREANRWLQQQQSFSTCSATQMGFLRVSMSAAYGATFIEARTALEAIVSMPAHRFLDDDTRAAALPEITSRHDVTDAHLLVLATRFGLKLATLDEQLCAARWAAGNAVNPLGTAASSAP